MALEALKEGHRKALKVVEELEGALARAKAGDAAAALAVTRGLLPFLEKEQEVHFRQEEEGLFLYLARITGDGPIQAMVGEHESYWKAVAGLRELAEKGGEALLIARLLAHIIELLRGHIHREETTYFPLAEQRLSPEQLDAVDREMEAIAGLR
ncbi:MAG: Hemerythrin protein [Dehalococcoidia bacterium]|nr:Hemerythrin protein [Dehalococcoidia bacterium]